MRVVSTAPNEFYHVFGRGNNKERIFLDDRDYIRFMFLVLFFQSPEGFRNIGRHVSDFKKSGVFIRAVEKQEEISFSRIVELVCFAIMPNHYHLIVFNKDEKNISKYMQRVLTAYSKYFNEKYNHVGHVFQGPYKAVHIDSDVQMKYLSTYIHRNPKEIKGVNYRKYPWSSYQDYVVSNRWGDLLRMNIILDSFDSLQEYRQFVDESIAKE